MMKGHVCLEQPENLAEELQNRLVSKGEGEQKSPSSRLQLERRKQGFIYAEYSKWGGYVISLQLWVTWNSLSWETILQTKTMDVLTQASGKGEGKVLVWRGGFPRAIY